MRSLRTTLATLMLIAALPAAGLSQELLVGPRGSFNLAEFTGGDAEDFWGLNETRTGVSLGLLLYYGIADSFGFQPELYWTMKGAEADQEEAVAAFKLGYIELPLLARITFPAGRVSPFILGGPAFALRVSCAIEQVVQGFGDSGDCEDFVVPVGADLVEIEIATFDFGMMWGGGFAIDAGSGVLTLDFRFTHGFDSIDDSELGTDLVNRVFQLTLGYGFRTGR